jgi:hypothetical protein
MWRAYARRFDTERASEKRELSIAAERAKNQSARIGYVRRPGAFSRPCTRFQGWFRITPITKR